MTKEEAALLILSRVAPLGEENTQQFLPAIYAAIDTGLQDMAFDIAADERRARSLIKYFSLAMSNGKLALPAEIISSSLLSEHGSVMVNGTPAWPAPSRQEMSAATFISPYYYFVVEGQQLYFRSPSGLLTETTAAGGVQINASYVPLINEVPNELLPNLLDKVTIIATQKVSAVRDADNG
jgi:hypothetical protein